MIEAITYGFYLPGFTDPVKDEKTHEYLTRRQIWEPDGGAQLMFGIRNKIDCDFHIDGPRQPVMLDRDEYRIIASCIMHNCKSAIWWRVEYKDETCAWTAYAGAWNEELGVAVLIAPAYRRHPYVWISREPEKMQVGYSLLDY